MSAFTNIAKEFKEFAVKGNVVDMAVGVIIGAAFGKIVTSLVTDIVMPPIGVLVGGVNFTSLQLTLKDGVGQVAPVTLRYGVFLQTIFDFMIVALAIFAVIKLINQLKREEIKAPAPPPAPPEPPRQELLLAEIRDAVREMKKP